MKLITLVNIVCSLANKENDKEEFHKVLSDINVYKDGDYLFFNSIGLSSKIEDCLLNTNYEVAPYIVFVKKDDMWSAFELDTKQKFLDYCAMSEFDNSIRIVFEKFDYNLVQLKSDISRYTKKFKNTLVVKVF